jgi:Chitobiase/beta-hexosaminidase C-terminal domain
MRVRLIVLFTFIFLVSNAQPVFQLAPPMLNYSTVFLASSPVRVEMIFNQPGAAIHYTTDGREPSITDPVYQSPILVSRKTILKAKTMGKDFLSSETVTASFIPAGKKISKITYSPPHESYANSKPDILNDDTGGFTNYRKNWLGYERDTIQIDIELAKKEKVRSVMLDLLQDEGSWIFLPSAIELSYFDERSRSWKPAGNRLLPSDKPSPKQTVQEEMKLPAGVSAEKLRVVLLSVKNIPDWHAGKGNHAWLFIDEIKVY